MNPVFDTNILIDNLLGIDAAKAELDRFPKARISIVTWIEVMVGADGEEDERNIRQFLRSFETIPLDDVVADTAVQLRRRFRLKLPDAVIWASAKSRDCLLITRNTRDYPADEADIRHPYSL
jgi:predicted nucleic acid-binding protein